MVRYVLSKLAGSVTYCIIAHCVLDDVANIGPILLRHVAVRDHNHVLMVARPRHRAAFIAIPRVGDTLSAITGGALELGDVLRPAVSPSAVVVGRTGKKEEPYEWRE
jgi:hypothetical protein